MKKKIGSELSSELLVRVCAGLTTQEMADQARAAQKSLINQAINGQISQIK